MLDPASPRIFPAFTEIGGMTKTHVLQRLSKKTKGDLDNVPLLHIKSFGYVLKDGDEVILTFSIQKVENTIKNDCNVSSIPGGLENIAIDMAAGEFLTAKPDRLFPRGDHFRIRFPSHRLTKHNLFHFCVTPFLPTGNDPGNRNRLVTDRLIVAIANQSPVLPVFQFGICGAVRRLHRFQVGNSRHAHSTLKT